MNKERIIVDIDYDCGSVHCDYSDGCTFAGIYEAAIALLCCIKNDANDFDEFIECIKQDLTEDSVDNKGGLLC